MRRATANQGESMGKDNNKEAKIYVELKFGPKWTYISTVRTFVENFMAITLENKKQATGIAMAVNELIENAVKFSDLEGSELNIYVTKEQKIIKVIVSNHASQENIDDLQRCLKNLFENSPLDAYLKRMKDSVVSLDGKSALGLARIRYECQAQISTSVENGIVRITAEIPTEKWRADNE
jgi:hypothetical protein